MDLAGLKRYSHVIQSRDNGLKNRPVRGQDPSWPPFYLVSRTLFITLTTISKYFLAFEGLK